VRWCRQLLPVLLVCVACVHSAPPSGASLATTSAPLRATSPLAPLGLAELDRANTADLYDAIAKLRPAYFATRGSTSILNASDVPIVVIINGRIVGGVAELRNISVAITRSVRRLDASDVYQMTGQSVPSGGIEVVLGR
jgi:hypothetical protein